MCPLAMPAAQPKLTFRSLFCYIVILILTLIFIVGLGVLIAWLLSKPKKLHYSIENASVQNYNLTDDNHISATFNFAIHLYNPNHRTSVYYKSIEVFLKLKDQTLAFDTVEPFHQLGMNVTEIHDTLVAQNVAVSESNGKHLRGQVASGKIVVDVYVKARVKFKVGIWKSTRQTAKIECSSVSVSLSQSNKSLNSSCDVEI